MPIKQARGQDRTRRDRVCLNAVESITEFRLATYEIQKGKKCKGKRALMIPKRTERIDRGRKFGSLRGESTDKTIIMTLDSFNDWARQYGDFAGLNGVAIDNAG